MCTAGRGRYMLTCNVTVFVWHNTSSGCWNILSSRRQMTRLLASCDPEITAVPVAPAAGDEAVAAALWDACCRRASL